MQRQEDCELKACLSYKRAILLSQTRKLKKKKCVCEGCSSMLEPWPNIYEDLDSVYCAAGSVLLNVYTF